LTECWPRCCSPTSSIPAELGDRRWRELLDRHDEITFAEISSFQGRVIKQTGDGVLATFDGPTRAVLCAIALADRIPRIGIDIRSGLHTGECERRGDDIGGIAVHIAARIAALANAREVLVSNTVKDLVYGSEITFEDRGAPCSKACTAGGACSPRRADMMPSKRC
jgi:class 3 adenylate cyclase